MSVQEFKKDEKMGSQEKEHKFERGRGKEAGAILRTEPENRDASVQGSTRALSRFKGENLSELTQIDPRSLPTILLENRKTLPNCSAVYFVWSKDGECLYVGRTSRLVVRWRKHDKLEELKQYSGVKIAWLECVDLVTLSRVENFFINKLNPLLNKVFDKKTETITTKKHVHPVRFSDQEYEELKVIAKAEGVSIGELVRESVKEKMRHSNSLD